MKSRLSDKQLRLARTECEKPIKVSYWAGWDSARNGWCLYQNYENGMLATLIAGPFDTREEAERTLGPELKSLLIPLLNPPKRQRRK